MRISDWSSDVCSSDLLLMLQYRPARCAGLQHRLGRTRGPLDRAPEIMGKALLGTRRGFLRRRRRARRQFQPIEHAPLGSRFFLRALRWLGRLRRLGRQLQAVEHAAPRLSLGRGLRIPCAAALADLAWAWISAHLAHGASTRAKKLHTLALG